VSVRALRRATAVLALAGVAIAGYLTWVHYAGLQPFCVGGGGSCERVQSSKWSELAGIPVAVLGLAGYALLLALVGAGFSAWLTYVELAKIDAICQWCAASAAIMVLLAVVSVMRLLRVD
jgi:uncharacterized membrane protein